MIGPSPYPEGGTSIPFKILVDYLRRQDIAVHVVAIPRGGKNIVTKPLKFLAVLLKTVWLAPRVDLISVHIPTPQLANVGIAALAIARLFRRAFVVRQFSGMDATELRLHQRLLAEQVIRKSTVLFVEARKQCENVKQWLSREAFWYPNHRVAPSGPGPQCHRNGRFVYIGRVRADKGMGEILDATALLRGRCCVDVYGPCEEHFDQETFSSTPYVRYRGVAANESIPSILSEHSALLLPTYWMGEGYPGIVIEAFQAGLPVIATRWKYLPEIVDETCGILVEPRDVEGLRRAMDRLAGDTELAERLRIGALARGTEFSADRWAELFVCACHIACEHSDDRTGMQRRIEALYKPLQ